MKNMRFSRRPQKLSNVQYLRTAEEIRSAMTQLGFTHANFADDMQQHGIRTTRQALWKWLTGKNKTGIPGYVGVYLYAQYGLHKGNVQVTTTIPR